MNPIEYVYDFIVLWFFFMIWFLVIPTHTAFFAVVIGVCVYSQDRAILQFSGVTNGPNFQHRVYDFLLIDIHEKHRIEPEYLYAYASAILIEFLLKISLRHSGE